MSYVSVVCLFIDLLKNIMKLISKTWFLIFNIIGANMVLSNAFRVTILKSKRKPYTAQYAHVKSKLHIMESILDIGMICGVSINTLHPFRLNNNNPFIRSTWPIANYYQCVTIGHRSVLTNATRAYDDI